MRSALSRSALSLALFVLGTGSLAAASLAPPMLDITRQCDVTSRRNERAMSECVVAESEARAEMLQNWTKYSDDTADRCIKAGRKARRFPYSAMAKCLSDETAAVQADPAAAKK